MRFFLIVFVVAIIAVFGGAFLGYFSSTRQDIKQLKKEVLFLKKELQIARAEGMIMGAENTLLEAKQKLNEAKLFSGLSSGRLINNFEKEIDAALKDLSEKKDKLEDYELSQTY